MAHFFTGYFFIKMIVALVIFFFTGILFFSLRRKRYTLALLASLLILITGVIIHIFFGYFHADSAGHAWGNEDAFIGYRYSQNLAMGNGFVFNPGERVEGYTNFLYLLCMAAGYLIAGMNNLYIFSCLFNVACIIIALIIFYIYVASRLGKAMAAIAAFLFSLSTSIWIFVASGLETPLVLLIQLAMWIAVERTVEKQQPRDIFLLCLTFILSILVRADGFIMPAVALFYLLLKGQKQSLLYGSITVAATLFLYLTWRYSYYGYLLPNTYYVKICGPLAQRLTSASWQFTRIIFNNGLLAYILAFAVAIIEIVVNSFKRKRLGLRNVSFEVLFAVALLVYWFYVGGDHYRERFLLVLFPLGIFTLLRFIAGSAPQKIFLFLIILIVALQLKPLTIFDSRFDYSVSKYDCRITLGRFLGQRHKGELLAVSAVGKIPYFSELKIVDMLGTNDLYIGHKKVDFFGEPAHNKFDADYVLARKPDLIADWVEDAENLDLINGMKREKYTANYRPLYLLNTGKNSFCPNIVEINNLPKKDIINLVNRGYRYIVLEKKK